MKQAIFFCIVGLPLFGKEGSGTPVFKILVRALKFNLLFNLAVADGGDLPVPEMSDGPTAIGEH